MSIGFIFWLLMLLCLISWASWRFGGPPFAWTYHSYTLLTFVLLFLLGWKVFGFIVQGA